MPPHEAVAEMRLFLWLSQLAARILILTKHTSRCSSTFCFSANQKNADLHVGGIRLCQSNTPQTRHRGLRLRRLMPKEKSHGSGSDTAPAGVTPWG